MGTRSSIYSSTSVVCAAHPHSESLAACGVYRSVVLHFLLLVHTCSRGAHTIASQGRYQLGHTSVKTLIRSKTDPLELRGVTMWLRTCTYTVSGTEVTQTDHTFHHSVYILPPPLAPLACLLMMISLKPGSICLTLSHSTVIMVLFMSSARPSCTYNRKTAAGQCGLLSVSTTCGTYI